jgi:hypothetical protein
MNKVHVGVALAATIVATAASPAHAATPRLCGVAVEYKTEIQWGGTAAPWHSDADLDLALVNRHSIVDQTAAPAAGTKLHWTGPNGNADITFGAGNTFAGTAQFPKEGPVGYRGAAARRSSRLCDTAAVAKTEIQWGGDTAPWHPDADLVALISNRHTIVDRTTAPAGTTLTWTSPNGNGSITFTATKGFTGTAQFPNEGPVGYRGTF